MSQTCLLYNGKAGFQPSYGVQVLPRAWGSGPRWRRSHQRPLVGGGHQLRPVQAGTGQGGLGCERQLIPQNKPGYGAGPGACGDGSRSGSEFNFYPAQMTSDRAGGCLKVKEVMCLGGSGSAEMLFSVASAGRTCSSCSPLLVPSSPTLPLPPNCTAVGGGTWHLPTLAVAPPSAGSLSPAATKLLSPVTLLSVSASCVPGPRPGAGAADLDKTLRQRS